MIKKIIQIFICMCCIYASIVPSYAVENKFLNKQEELLTIGFESSQMVGRKTFYGNGGSSKLNWLSSGKCLSWSLHPKNNEPLNFNGTINVSLVSTGKIKLSFHLSKFGSDISDVIYVKGLKKGILYKANFEGVAVGVLSGNKYVIIKDAHITFTY